MICSTRQLDRSYIFIRITLDEPIELLYFSVAFHPNNEIAEVGETYAKSLAIPLV